MYDEPVLNSEKVEIPPNSSQILDVHNLPPLKLNQGQRPLQSQDFEELDSMVEHNNFQSGSKLVQNGATVDF